MGVSSVCHHIYTFWWTSPLKKTVLILVYNLFGEKIRRNKCVATALQWDGVLSTVVRFK